MENKTNCWEYFRCEEQQCPAFKSNTKECWLISGTRCHDKTQGDFIEKITLCIDCGFLQHNLDVDTIEDTLKVVNGQYKKFKKMFEQRQETDQQLLETISGEIAIRKQAEKSAITSEENFKTLVKSIPGIVYKGFDDWTVEFVDDNVNALTGYAADLFNSKKMKWSDIVVKEDVAHLKNIFITALKHDKSFTRQYRIRTQNSDILWIEERGTIICNPAGRIESITGIFFDITEQKLNQEKLKLSFENLRKSLRGTIQAMATTVESRDPYTAGHQQRVADLGRRIAEIMGLADHQIEGIRMAGAIHDLGKISIPSEILSKPTRLSDIEFALIKTHSQVGYDILKGIEFPWPIALIVHQHHEKLNGSGYPLGLSGEAILIEAKILAVADVVEAMASHRPYRPSLGIDPALDEISKNKGIFYDSKAVDACLKLFRENGFKLD